MSVDLRDVSVGVQAEDLRRVLRLERVDVVEVLVEFRALGDREVLVEQEVLLEERLVEPDFAVGVQQALVEVVRHAPAVMHLADHIAHESPVHALHIAFRKHTHLQIIDIRFKYTRVQTKHKL